MLAVLCGEGNFVRRRCQSLKPFFYNAIGIGFTYLFVLCASGVLCEIVICLATHEDGGVGFSLTEGDV
jgi:hypothetical protein